MPAAQGAGGGGEHMLKGLTGVQFEALLGVEDGRMIVDARVDLLAAVAWADSNPSIPGRGSASTRRGVVWSEA